MARPSFSLSALSGRARVGLLVVAVVILLSSAFTFTNTFSGDGYPGEFNGIHGGVPAVDISDNLEIDTESQYPQYVPSGYFINEGPKFDVLTDAHANAVLLMVTRNKDVQNSVNSVRRLEDRFNRKRRYPWVFLNSEPWDETFKKRLVAVATGNVKFGLIPKEHWEQPSSINETLAMAARVKMSQASVPYADSISFRQASRFQSGFFFDHELVKPYEWYWRVDPDVDYTCDVKFDPFLYLQNHNKTFGFTMSTIESPETIPTLWSVTQDFMKAHPEHVAKSNAMHFISDEGENYNSCTFWANSEIGSLSFFRSPQYQAFFSFLDQKGGFYYERWGDSVVHTLAAALLQSKDKLHFFAPIGFEANSKNHCPTKSSGYNDNACQCGPEHSFDERPDSCLSKFTERVGISDMGKGW